jgi:hypothetical protein
MRPIAIALSLLLTFLATASPRRAAEIAERFTKTKYKHKQKHGIEKSRYLDVQSRIAVRPAAEYSGHYDAELPQTTLTLDVTANGIVTGRGNDPRPFTLRDGRVRDAVLTAIKVYADGTTEPLEGAFLNRAMREGTSPDRITDESTEFGLGLVNVDVRISGGISLDKLFYHRVR